MEVICERERERESYKDICGCIDVYTFSRGFGAI